MTIPSPSAVSQGEGGVLRVGGLTAGRLTSWRLVISPTTGKPTLFGEGRFLRFYAGALGGGATINLTPTPPPARIGRPKPPPAKPFTLRGRIVEFSPARIVIAEGEVLWST